MKGRTVISENGIHPLIIVAAGYLRGTLVTNTRLPPLLLDKKTSVLRTEPTISAFFFLPSFNLHLAAWRRTGVKRRVEGQKAKGERRVELDNGFIRHWT
jgi:hypothetical protein